ncbi:MAG: sensor histidine kinase [Moorellales bacterium]
MPGGERPTEKARTHFWLLLLILCQAMFFSLSHLARYLEPLFPGLHPACWEIGEGILVVATVTASFVIVRRLVEAARREIELEAQAAQIASLGELLRALRAQRHDFINHVQAIYGLLLEGQADEALRYVHSVYGEVRQAGHLLQLGEPAVIALVQAKISAAEAKGVRVTLRVDPEFRYLPIPTKDLNRIIGNLLDNAVEAVGGKTEPLQRWVDLELSVDTNHFAIAVANGGEIPGEVARHLFEPGFTTKAGGDHEGLGLYTVKALAARYGGYPEVESGNGKTVFRITFAANRENSGVRPPDGFTVARNGLVRNRP